MKKTAIVSAALAAAAVGAAAWSLAQQGNNPRGKATLPGGKVTVDYGRPSASGRDVMAMIAPGSYWRMGADSATTLTTEADLQFGDQAVPKGSYTLVAHFLEKEKWSLVICKDTGERFQPEGTVAEVPGSFEKGQPLVEQLTIDLKEEAGKARLVLSWGAYRLAASFKVAS